MKKNRRRGQATMEFVLAYSAIILPVTSMIVFTAQMLWAWHSMVDFSRDGARYATTHCWQSGGENTVSWMRQNVPLTFDRDQFAQGPAEIEITFMGRNAETGALEEFSCDGGDCSRACQPDTVRVRIRGYEFRSFVSYLGMPPIVMPEFQTTLAMESGGCNPESEECLP
ncbi:MAG: pilus assembly protein [Bryobacterales bacterium]|nr:pilus assembly protein [Bryobacterales bacterium]